MAAPPAAVEHGEKTKPLLNLVSTAAWPKNAFPALYILSLELPGRSKLTVILI
jgi:hypothetical protein